MITTKVKWVTFWFKINLEDQQLPNVSCSVQAQRFELFYIVQRESWGVRCAPEPTLEAVPISVIFVINQNLLIILANQYSPFIWAPENAYSLPVSLLKILI